jgi:type II secretory pathway component PulK
MNRTRTSDRAGMVLIIVLVICLGLVSITLLFAHSSMINYRGTENDIAGKQAEQSVMAGARYAQYLIQNSTPGAMPDRTSYTASELPVGAAFFWFIGRATDSTTTVTEPQWGLLDESAKLNLNNPAVTSAMLMKLPGMTDELAQAIIDWRDTTGEKSSNTYSQRKPPYRNKSAKFESIAEMVLLDGADRSILTGEDRNLNGLLDSYENDNIPAMTSSRGTSVNGPGIWEYVTVFSQEPLTTPSSSTDASGATGSTGGAKRIDITKYGAQPPQGVPVTSETDAIDHLLPSSAEAKKPAMHAIFKTTPATSVLDFYFRSTLTAEEFKPVEGGVYLPPVPAITGNYLPGLVNVNTASRDVLIALGLSTTDADAVISARQGNTSTSSSTSSSTSGSSGMGWLKGVLQPAFAATPAAKLLTGQTYVISADVAAVGRLGRGYRRTRFVFDFTGGGTPKLVYRRNLNSAGWALGREVRTLLKEERNRP